MRPWVFALMLVLVFVVVVFAHVTVEVPWLTFSAMAVAGGVPTLGSCPNGDVAMSAETMVGRSVWRYWASDAGRLVMAVWVKDVDGAPDAVGFGQIDPAHADIIPPLRWEPFNVAIHVNPCDFLFPAQATP